LSITIQALRRKDEKQMNTQTNLTITIPINQLGQKKDFQNELLIAIDQALLELGENNRTAIYQYLKMEFGLWKHDIPSRIGEFTEAMESILGTAAKLIELKIIEKIHCSNEEFTYRPRNTEIFFLDYVENFKQYLEE
jgi:hypothetical protein